MSKFVIKRDGIRAHFDEEKIKSAIQRAFIDNDGILTDNAVNTAEKIARTIKKRAEKIKRDLNIEEIQDMVEKGLMDSKRKDVAKAYVLYREERTRARGNPTDETILGIISGTDDYWLHENSNKNAYILSTQRDYVAGAICTDIARRKFFTKRVLEAHDIGAIHMHDADYQPAQQMMNCMLINLEDILQNGTVINGVMIERPHSFSTACNIACQVAACVGSEQLGGQSWTLSHLAPFVDESRKKFIQKFGNNPSLIEQLVADEIEKGVQTMQYQINTMSTTNGQAPFVSQVLDIEEVPEGRTREDLVLIIQEVLKQRIIGVKNTKGIYIAPTFPKLLYVLSESNCNESSKYWWLTELAAKCTAKRMVPDYISKKVMLEEKGDCYPCMGCRSFLTPDISKDGYGNVSKSKNYTGKHQYYGRFNVGVCTINLPFVALESLKTGASFWEVFDKYLDICHEGLQIKYNRLRGTKARVAPMHWMYGAAARFDADEVIDPLLFDNYATISLGYAGLWECVYALTGEKLLTPVGEQFGLKILQYLNDKCSKWREEENISYSLYGTPLESTTYKFAKALKKNFPFMEHVNDRDYITNSYHIHVTEEIDAFNKLAFESKFQKMSPGGAISYIEIPNLQKNVPAILEVIKFIYNNIMYAELNTKLDYCQVCGYDGEIKTIKDQETQKIIWECPNCKNRDQSKMNVIRRTCGYLGANFWNQGRTEEIAERVVHL